MGLEKFEIHFDNPSATYFGGQTLSGRLDITLDAPKKVRGISIVIKGEAQTQWTEHESYTDSKGQRQSRTLHFHGNEKYFDINYYLMGGSNSPTTEIIPGTHTYTFTCALPPTLPSSFEGSKGYVRYTVKAILDRPWKFDQTCKAAFTVLSPLDLNLIPRVKTCATLTMEKYFCCCWCKSGPLTGIIKIPYTGFVSGQIIPMTIEVDNASTTDVMGVVLKLNQVVTYYSHSPSRKSKKDETEIAKCSVGGNGVPARGSNTFRHDFTIPSLPPSNLSNCGIIDIDYEIKVKLEIPGFHSSLRGVLPITIGTVPLNNIAQVMPPPEQTINSAGLNTVVPSGDQPVLGWVPPSVAPGQDTYSLPPPTYEECQFGTNSIMDSTDSEHTKGANSYAPTYPVYNFGFMPQPPTGYMPLLPGATATAPGYMPIATSADFPTAPSAPSAPEKQ